MSDRLVPGLKALNVATTETVLGSVLATAHTADRLARKKGCGNRASCNLVAVGALADGIDDNIKNIRVVSRISEGRKDRHARLPENALLTRPVPGQYSADAVLDPLECEGQLALKRPSDRASMVLLGLAPGGSLSKVDSSQRVKYLGLPPGSPVGPGQIQLDTAPQSTIDMLCQSFGRAPAEIVATVLVRPWTAEVADGFRAAGATVNEIRAGDFQALVEAGTPVEPGGPIRIAAGIGGMPESFLAAMYHKWSGGTILVQPIPAGMEMRADQIRTYVYDKDSLIRSNDCVLAIAGITEAKPSLIAVPGTSAPFLVPGVRRSTLTGKRWATVLIVSPALEQRLVYVVECDLENKGQSALLAPGESLNEYLLNKYLSQGGGIETRITEAKDGEREYFPSGRFVPGLETLSESELIDLLKELAAQERITRDETVTPWDTCEYQVCWRIRNSS